MPLWVINFALKLYPVELVQTIRMSFYFLGEDAFFQDNPLIAPVEFESAMKKGKEYVLKTYLKSEKYYLITNIQEEFDDWCWFKPEPSYLFESKSVEKEIIEKEDSIESNEDEEDDYFFIGDEKHMSYCHKLYGDFNEKGLLSLQDKYDTMYLRQSKELVDNLCGQILRLQDDLELMINASSDQIDCESPWRNNYDIDEHGDIGEFASELYETATSLEYKIPLVVKKLAPLSRLMVIDPEYCDEPTDFHKEIDDYLDEPDGLKEKDSLLFI
mgnify:CR=1 FL=1